MRNICLIFILFIALLSCNGGLTEKILETKALQTGDQFNDIATSKTNIFNIVKYKSKNNNFYQINFRDTLITIKNEANELVNIFTQPVHLNSQKTAILVQVADNSGLSSPFYILSVKKGILQATKLDRAFIGKKKVTGLEFVSRSNLIINNDFLITTINGKVYPIKRQFENKPIDGRIFMLSKDGATLIFLTSNSFYQYNYISNENFNLPIEPNLVNDKEGIFRAVQRDFKWEKNNNGTFFLIPNVNDDRIVDIKEFKH